MDMTLDISQQHTPHRQSPSIIDVSPGSLVTPVTSSLRTSSQGRPEHEGCVSESHGTLQSAADPKHTGRAASASGGGSSPLLSSPGSHDTVSSHVINQSYDLASAGRNGQLEKQKREPHQNQVIYLRFLFVTD